MNRRDALLLLAIPGAAWARPRASVRDFGAKGDGEADDTGAFQQAVNSRLGSLRIPPGVYRFTAPVTVYLDRAGPLSVHGEGAATIRMEAPGPAIHLLGTHGGTADPRTVNENVWLRQRAPFIDGVEIVGAHPEAVGVRAEGVMQAVFTRLLIRQALHGIHLYRRNRNVIISDCHLYENRGIGVFLDRLDLHQINITGSHISYNGGGGVVARGSEIRNLHIGACDLESNMSPGQPPTANVLLDTREGTVREGAITGCTLQHNHDAPGSANIRLQGRSREAPQKVGHFTIGDNVLSDVMANIHLQHARGVTVTGNTFWKGFEHNLLAEDCSNLVIGPNLLDRNPDYRPADSFNGVELIDCSDSTIQGLHINHSLQPEAALILRRCRRMNITGVTILDSTGVGLLAEGLENSRISDCLIRNDREPQGYIALRVSAGQGNQIEGNLLGGQAEISE